MAERKRRVEKKAEKFDKQRRARRAAYWMIVNGERVPGYWAFVPIRSRRREVVRRSVERQARLDFQSTYSAKPYSWRDVLAEFMAAFDRCSAVGELLRDRRVSLALIDEIFTALIVHFSPRATAIQPVARLHGLSAGDLSNDELKRRSSLFREAAALAKEANEVVLAGHLRRLEFRFLRAIPPRPMGRPTRAGAKPTRGGNLALRIDVILGDTKMSQADRHRYVADFVTEFVGVMSPTAAKDLLRERYRRTETP